MDRKSFSTVIDETFSKMESDVRILKTQQQTLTENIKSLEKKRDTLSKEILDGEKRLALVKEEYQGQVDAMLKSAQDKLTKANSKETEAVGKSANLDQKTKEAKDLIQSNKGLQDNLNKRNEIVKANISILEGLVATIEKTLKDIK